MVARKGQPIQPVAMVALYAELQPPRVTGQDPEPGSDEKCFSNLSGTPCHSLASAGASPFWLILGQLLAYSAFTDSHFSSPDSVSALMASGGHSGSQTPQSMHSSGGITSMFSPS